MEFLVENCFLVLPPASLPSTSQVPVGFGSIALKASPDKSSLRKPETSKLALKFVKSLNVNIRVRKLWWRKLTWNKNKLRVVVTPKRHHFRLAAAGLLSWWSEELSRSVSGPKITKTNRGSKITTSVHRVCWHVSRCWLDRCGERENMREGGRIWMPRHLSCLLSNPAQLPANNYEAGLANGFDHCHLLLEVVSGFISHWQKQCNSNAHNGNGMTANKDNWQNSDRKLNCRVEEQKCGVDFGLGGSH